MKAFFSFIILTLLFITAVYFYNQHHQPGPVGGAFTLISSNKQIVTEKDIRAKPAVIFFGYTMCPDVCPTTLFDMQQWIKALGNDADKLGFWFFTVDPERDTPEIMNEYLSNSPKNIIGVSGDPAEVRKVIKNFNIVAIKVPGENKDYSYDHTAAVILLHKGGRSFGIIPYQADIGANSERGNIGLDKLRQLIKEDTQ
ncbi:SCO family protein [Bartonella sp. TP]|uniref:SCO family protein n=1 Tax=Bartonella sp. TP TaxID=3057550 RepID=UPI0025B1EC4D|nr:SCO family protein [Bartonella sp. TP]MDN5249687.1 SCO family protein [Alphaproteobacteria bacterium]WJW79776.1 SCO family protein [Bartonella sp. TP]